MQFVYPLYFFFTIFIAAFILFYFFRKQYTKQMIPSNLLWTEVVNEIKASSWLHKWQNNLLFWLHLLCLLLLLFALVQPVTWKEGLKGEQIIFLFDTSASMASKPNQQNKLEASKKEAIEMVHHLNNNQSVTLIDVNDQPNIMVNNETDQKKIINVINHLDITYAHDNFDKATQMAASLAVEGKSAIHIFSDAVTNETVAQHLRNFYTEVHNVGNATDSNLSILSFGVAKKNERIAGIAMVKNQNNQKETVPFQVVSAGAVVWEKTITLLPNEQKIITMESLPKKAYYEAKINIEDQYTIDNKQTAIFTSVLSSIYAPDAVNAFLLKGFSTIGLQVVQMEKQADIMKKKDGIYLFNGSSVGKNMSQPLIFFYESKNKVALKEELKLEEDTLFTHVDMKDVYIKEAYINKDKNLETILKSGDIPLIQKGKINGQPVIYINFSIQDSDWPLHPSFPVFLYNSYQWLSAQSNYIGDFQPLEEKSLNLNANIKEWEIFNEKDEVISSYRPDEESFQAPKYPGVYQLTSGNAVFYFSVNLDDREKNIQSEKSFSINDQTVQNTAKKVAVQQNTVWYWFALLTFVLLIIEWEVYRRASRI
ncbi:vWA domain-containing protein [Niallia sp. 01092]|uniref:vWA domain-containing protein n=1 Tax=unclassified Niallia TaxID=2837522 RepID=UPI003FCF9324